MTRSRWLPSRVLAIVPAHYLVVGLSAALIVGNGIGAFASLWRPGLVASLIAFSLFTGVAAGLTWLTAHAMHRQQDATAQLQRSEERLREQTALLQSTVESMGEGLSVFDRDGRLIAWNAHFFELLDLPDERLRDSSLREILTYQCERGDFGPLDPATDIAQRLEAFYRDLPLVRERMTPTGRTLQIRRNAMPGGGVVTVYSDVTQRKAAQEKMEQAWAQAELANRSKGEFLANMSHELRTPLNAIIGFAEVIAAEHLGAMANPRYLEYCRDIHSSGLHLLSIINDVLDMSKIEAGKLDIHEGEMFVAPLVVDTIRMMRERAQQRSVELVCREPGSDIVVNADERALKQCLLNLLSNAIKFSPEGGRVVVAAALDADDGLVLSVKDDGIGMSAADVERALQPFGQANSSITRNFGGTGLGLPITRGLIEAHGGRLAIDSARGVGTEVRVALPPERTRHYDAQLLAAVRLSA